MRLVPLYEFRTLSLNGSDMDQIGQTTAAVIQHHTPNPEQFPHLRATVSYLRPDGDVDLWCLPHMAFIGSPPQAEIDRVTAALNNAITRAAVMMQPITPAEFYEQRQQTA